MRQPALQNLRKENRDVILPDINMRLLYVDYSQFEAGILASMSKDELLINLYNQDIYNDLAQFVFGDKSKRGDAKVIFYRYMYGDQSMSEFKDKIPAATGKVEYLYDPASKRISSRISGFPRALYIVALSLDGKHLLSAVPAVGLGQSAVYPQPSVIA